MAQQPQQQGQPQGPDLKSVQLLDFSGGIVNTRVNPVNYDVKNLWSAENIDVSDKWMKTRLGKTASTAAALMSGGVVEKLVQVRFPSNEVSYLLAQVRSSTLCKLYVSKTRLPSSTLSFTELYDLGLTAGGMSVATLNDRVIITEGVSTVPLVFLGGLETDGSDWAFPKQIFCTLDGLNYFDMTTALTDNDDDSIAYIPALPVAGGIYVCLDVAKSTGMYFKVHQANATPCTMAVARWYNGAWDALSITDNTATTGVTLAKSGTVTWAEAEADYSAIAEVPGYWYRITFSLVASATSYVYSDIASISDVTQPNYLGTIVAWNRNSSNLGTFRNSGNTAVAVGSGTDVIVGSNVIFNDGVESTIVDITGDGTGASGVRLSVDHATGNLARIEYGIVTSGSLISNSYGGADGLANASTTVMTTQMTSNVLPSPQVAAASEEAIFAAWKAFNQENTTMCWETASATGWIKMDCGSTIVINKYMIQAKNVAGETGFPNTWTLKGSLDDSSWDTLDTQTGIADPGQNLWATAFTFTNAIAYRYYKLDITVKNGSANLAVGELRLIESPLAYPVQICIARSGDAIQADVSAFTNLDSIAVTQTTPSTSTTWHVISFDERNTWKAYVSSVWRTIVQNDVGIWKYNNGTILVPASTNNEHTALRQAFGVASNRWTKTAVEAMARAQWEASGGYSASVDYVDFAWGLTTAVDSLPSLDKYVLTGMATGSSTMDVVTVADVDLQDLKGEISYWNKGVTAKKGRFEGAEVAFGNDAVIDRTDKVGFPYTAHGLVAGDKVRFYGFTETTYNATHVCGVTTSENEIVVVITYVPETMSAACKMRKVPTLGAAGDCPAIELGVKVVFADTSVRITGGSGDGTDPDIGVVLSVDHADADVTAIYGTEVGSGVVTIPTLTITESATPDGADNPNVAYLIPVMTSNILPSPLVASSSVADANVWYCFENTGWFYEQPHSRGMLEGAWIKIDLGSTKIVNKYDFFCSGTVGFHNIQQWVLEGSTDDSGWTELHAVESDYPPPGDNKWYGREGDNAGYFTFVNSTAYRYYRFTIGNGSYGGDYWEGMGGMKLVESVPTTTIYVPTYMQAVDTVVGKAVDCSTWSHITGIIVTETKAGASKVWHSVSFDAQTTYSVFRSAAWRDIAKNDSGTWKYNSSVTTTPTWVAADNNTKLQALKQAFAVTQNQMTGTDFAAITQSQWESTGGFSVATTTLDFAWGLMADVANLPSFDKYVIGYIVDHTATIEPTNASTDISQQDLKGTITKWVAGTLTGAGQFQDATSTVVPVGGASLVEGGLLITFSDADTRTITKIEGTGIGANDVYLSSYKASTAITSLTALVYAAGVVIVNSDGSDYGALNTSLASATPVMTGPSLPVPYAATHSTAYDHLSWRAFNQTNTDAYDCWKTLPGTTAGWIRIDMGAAITKKVNKYYLKSAKTANAMFPSAWTLEGSNNASAWTVVDTQTAISDPGSDTWVGPYSFTNDTAYRYYRLNITTSNGTAIELGEIKLIENVPNYCTGELLAQITAVASPPTASNVTSVALTNTQPGSSTLYVVISFDSGITYKLYNVGTTAWIPVIGNNSGTWQYNTVMGTPTWQAASPNSFLGALDSAPGMTKSVLEALTQAELTHANAYTTVNHHLMFGYKLKGSGTDIPSVDKATVTCVVDPTYVVTELSKLTYTGPCQPLCNLHASGTGDLAMGFVVHRTVTNLIADYTVEVADGALTTGADVNALTSSDYIYIAGVEQFFAIMFTMVNDANNNNVSAMSGEYWNGVAWSALTSFTDGTSSSSKTLAIKGELKWAEPTDWRECKPLNYSQTMGYWIRLKVSATLSASVGIATVAVTSKPLPLVKHKFALSFANRLALANRPDRRCQVDVSRPFEEYGFSGSTSVSIEVGGQDQILSVIRSYDQMWMTKLEEWYQITEDSFADLIAPRGESAAQAPVNADCIVLAPIDKYGKSQTGPIADAKNKQGVYFLNHNGAWCFTGAELFKLGEWVSWWDSTSANPKLDLNYLHLSSACFWAFRNWLIWSVPMITGTDIAQTTCNRLIIYDITNGVWIPPASIAATSLCQAREYQANAPAKTGQIDLLCGGYDGYIYRLFDPTSTTDAGTAITSTASTGWLGFEAPQLQKELRAVTIYGSITTGNLTFSVLVDGEATAQTANIFTVSSLSLSATKAYVLDFSHKNVSANMFKFTFAWSGPGNVYGLNLELAAVRGWPSTA